MPKPDPRALELFEGLVPTGPHVKVKPMFGNLGAFANGKMFMGVFGQHVFVRLAEEDREKALTIPGAAIFEPMDGRPMKEYVVLPPSSWKDAKNAGVWIQKSLDFAARLAGASKGPPEAKAPAKAGPKGRKPK